MTSELSSASRTIKVVFSKARNCLLRCGAIGVSLLTHVNVQVVEGGHTLGFRNFFTVHGLVVEGNLLVVFTKL